MTELGCREGKVVRDNCVAKRHMVCGPKCIVACFLQEAQACPDVVLISAANMPKQKLRRCLWCVVSA
jgi:hypothetical protein